MLLRLDKIPIYTILLINKKLFNTKKEAKNIGLIRVFWKILPKDITLHKEKGNGS